MPGSSIGENNHLPVREGISLITGLGAYNLPKNAEIHIFFNVTAEGIVTLRAFEPISMKELTVTATVALLSEEEVARAKQMYDGLSAST